MKKTQAAKVILILLLLILGSFIIVASGTKLGDILFPTSEADAGDAAPSELLPSPGTSTDAPPASDPAPDLLAPQEPAFPIAPIASERYAFEQRLEGAPQDFVVTTLGYYICVEQEERLYLYHMRADGTLDGRANMGAGAFLAMSVTADGIALLIRTPDAACLYLADPETLALTPLPLPGGESGAFYVLSDGFLVRVDRALYHIRGGVIAASTELPSADCRALFLVGNSFTVLTNGADGYEVSMYDTQLNRYCALQIAGRRALGFCPIPAAQGVNYAVLEEGGGSLYLRRYTPSFHVASAIEVGLGSGVDGALYTNGESLFVLVLGSENRFYLSDGELNFTLGERTLLRGAETISGLERYQTGYVAIFEKEGALQLLDVRDDATTATRILGEGLHARQYHRTQTGVTLLMAEGEASTRLVHVGLEG